MGGAISFFHPFSKTFLTSCSTSFLVFFLQPPLLLLLLLLLLLPTDYDPKKSFALRATPSPSLLFFLQPPMTTKNRSCCARLLLLLLLFFLQPPMTTKNRSRCTRPKTANSYYNFIRFGWISSSRLQRSIKK